MSEHYRDWTEHNSRMSEHYRDLTEHNSRMSEHYRDLTEHNSRMSEHYRDLTVVWHGVDTGIIDVCTSVWYELKFYKPEIVYCLSLTYSEDTWTGLTL